ncbi:MAG: tRNA (N(6)-L-threonylcarbamoyladenosine(37)-C(2))-methylthiotransferase MtaB [Clostridia bacterium]|nr:tRNA (N(6)-L-threonylcarbamoyladenosine(37)-C(2))-methylthiotransferase MtaB [Clostridia bacterium]
MTFGIYTLGCRVNQYESRVIAERLTGMGYTELPFSSRCDIYIINSCAVTAESVRKSRQMIRRAKKTSDGAKIIVTGCFAQISPDEVKALGDDIHIIGNKNKLNDILNAVEATEVCVCAEEFNIPEYENYILTKPTRAREYIKIQDGCEGKCAYCVIPRARGPVRSKPRESVIEEVKALAQRGVKEIILTGIEIASYQYDLPSLIEEIDTVNGIERISLGSLEPTLITEELAKRFAKIKKLTPHFHISVQSGSTTVLNRMRRKYNVQMLERSIGHLKKHIPNLRLTCDIIVGFPGESEAEFEETRAFLERNRFLHAHIFTYSKRPLTVAADMKDQIPENIKIQRSSVLNSLQTKIKAELLTNELERCSVPVLFETYADNVNTGHSDNYIEYRVASADDLTGQLVYVKPISSDTDTVTAEISSIL